MRLARVRRQLRRVPRAVALSIVAALFIVAGAFSYANMGQAQSAGTIAWSQNTGGSTVFPACGSASAGSATCSGGTAQDTVTWDISGVHEYYYPAYDPDTGLPYTESSDAGPPQYVRIYLNGSVAFSGHSSGSHTLTGLAPNTHYTCTVKPSFIYDGQMYNYGEGEAPGWHADSYDCSFTTPSCGPFACTMSVSKPQIQPNEKFTLSWLASGATSGTLSSTGFAPGHTSPLIPADAGSSDQIVFSAPGSYTFTGSFTGPSGTNSCGTAITVCVANKGAACTSSPNSCGQTAAGTIQCDGSCSAGTPSDDSCTQPDLTAGAVSPTTATVGTAVTLLATISDADVATGKGFTDLFEINPTSIPASFADIQTLRTYASAALAKGGSNTASASYTFASAGTWYVRACADTNASNVGSIAESDETNNCADTWTAVTVGNSCVSNEGSACTATNGCAGTIACDGSCAQSNPSCGDSCDTLSTAISANPTRIQGSSGTTKVSWKTDGVPNSRSCTIYKNGTSWQTPTPNSCTTQVSQGPVSDSIDQQTKYCIDCNGAGASQATGTPGYSCVVVDVGSSFVHF